MDKAKRASMETMGRSSNRLIAQINSSSRPLCDDDGRDVFRQLSSPSFCPGRSSQVVCHGRATRQFFLRSEHGAVQD